LEIGKRGKNDQWRGENLRLVIGYSLLGGKKGKRLEDRGRRPEVSGERWGEEKLTTEGH